MSFSISELKVAMQLMTKVSLGCLISQFKAGRKALTTTLYGSCYVYFTVTIQAAEAIRRCNVGIKCATITPDEKRVEGENDA